MLEGSNECIYSIKTHLKKNCNKQREVKLKTNTDIFVQEQ